MAQLLIRFSNWSHCVIRVSQCKTVVSGCFERLRTLRHWSRANQIQQAVLDPEKSSPCEFDSFTSEEKLLTFNHCSILSLIGCQFGPNKTCSCSIQFPVNQNHELKKMFGDVCVFFLCVCVF